MLVFVVMCWYLLVFVVICLYLVIFIDICCYRMIFGAIGRYFLIFVAMWYYFLLCVCICCYLLVMCCYLLIFVAYIYYCLYILSDWLFMWLIGIILYDFLIGAINLVYFSTFSFTFIVFGGWLCASTFCVSAFWWYFDGKSKRFAQKVYQFKKIPKRTRNINQ